VRHLKTSSVTTAITMIVLALTLSAASAQEGYSPPNGFVPDADTAIKIARAVLSPIYGEQKIKGEEPLIARLTGDTWLVVGTLRCAPSCVGGTAEIQISKRDGRVLHVIHGR